MTTSKDTKYHTSDTFRYNVFKNTACMMHMGNMTKDFVPVGKEEQAEIKNEDNSIKVATLLGKTLF